MKVLLVEDHDLVRRGIREVFGDMDPDIECREVETGAEAEAMLESESFDLVVLDISLPDDNGLDLLRRLRPGHPGLPVLVCSMHPEKEYAAGAFAAGASGYISKRNAARELPRAVEAVRNGNKWVQPELAVHLAEALAGGIEPDPLGLLSRRERQVLRELARGASVSEIAKALRLSKQAVSTYKSRAMDKLGLENVAEVVRFGMDQGLV
jgi:DNA-binding NarL/FixJ family response regulator